MGISATSFQIAEGVRLTVQTVNSMGLQEFESVFGKGGAHLWSKYTKDYERDVGSFICGLDRENLARLVQNAISDSPKLDI